MFSVEEMPSIRFPADKAHLFSRLLAGFFLFVCFGVEFGDTGGGLCGLGGKITGRFNELVNRPTPFKVFGS